MSSTSRLSVPVPLEQPGKHVGHLRLPYSSNTSGYGWLPVPMIVVSNGDGPTGLLTAGIHGDEFEGQIALVKLARRLRPADVRGRLIILPTVNYPAARAGVRLSPTDHLNLNRAFPGDADGSPTAMLAHFLETELLPMADFAVDLHSGGNSMLHAPCAMIRKSSDPDRYRQMIGALDVFGAPFALVKSGQPGEQGRPDRGWAGAAERAGVPMIAAELAGGGFVSAAGVALADKAIARLLSYFGAQPDRTETEPPRPTEFVQVIDDRNFLFADHQGLFEPLFGLRDRVEDGQLAGRLHSIEAPWRDPIDVVFDRGGIVICQRAFGTADLGDCLCHTVAPFDPAKP